MTLAGFLTLTRQHVGTLLLAVLMAAGAAAGLALVLPASYTAEAVAYLRVTVPIPADDNTDAYYAATQMAPLKVDAVMPVFTSEAVAQRVVDSLDLDSTAPKVARSLTAAHEDDAVTVRVSARAESADDARRIADEVVRQTDTELSELEGGSYPIEIVLMTSAALAEVERTPSLTAFVAAGLIAGLAFGYAWVLLRELMDNSVRGSEDVRNATRMPFLGGIPKAKALDNGVVDVVPELEEPLRDLRTNVSAALGRVPGRVLVVASPHAGDGRSTIAVGLARVLAALGQRVVVVEGDLRHPSLSLAFRCSSESAGLAHLLGGRAELDQVLVHTRVERLAFIPAGECPPNPSELLASTRMAALLETLAGTCTVIVDTPPVDRFTDAAVLARRADRVLMVACAGRTTAEELNDAIKAVERGGGSILGVALNRLPVGWRTKRPLGGTFGSGVREEPKPAEIGGEAGARQRSASTSSMSSPMPS
ncbi:MAG: polysaccharide biosynthesis tyrosine autokinase [Actinomyces ruminicola]|nr:polysaccharide biosynthesis tyrosine autokinase [Actinomyces ruminicola]